MKNALIFIIVTVLAGAAGFSLQQYLATENTAAAAQINPLIGQPRPEFAMLDLDGKLRNIKEWDGQIVLLNFWATWCPPCMREIPGFIELQQELSGKGFQIVGVAVDDEAAVREFATKNKVNYPLLPGDSEAIELANKYGNRIGGLPYSVLIDKDGNIRDTISGELDKSRLESLLEQLGLRV
jgi:thiol-disulfide isomerase/thioredoxin